MTLRGVGAIFFGGCFMVVNGLMLILTGVWLRFSMYKAQLRSSTSIAIPNGRPGDPLNSVGVEFYDFIPFAVALLLIVSSGCLFAHVRLSK